MTFSATYQQLFGETHAALEKVGAFNFAEKFLGPNAHEASALRGLGEKFIPGAKGQPDLVNQVLKNRTMGQRIRTGVFGHGDTQRIMNEHLSRRLAQAPKEGRNFLPTAGAAGALGIGGTLGVQHAMSPTEPEMGGGDLSPQDLALLENYYAPGGQ